MVEARVERLSTPERDVVVAGAVLGDFDTQLLAAVADQRLDAVGDAIAAATNAGVLEIGRR